MDEQELLSSAQQHVFRARMDAKELTGPILERGSGSIVWDVTGKAYLDFNSGQMCSALGHNPPRIVSAIQEASHKLIHASSSLLNVNEIRLAEKRGRGLIQGIELVWDGGRKTPAVEAGPQIARVCLEKGLLCSVRRGGSVRRFVPPFTTTESQFDQAAEILDHALQGVKR